MNRPILAWAAAALFCLLQGISVHAQAPDLERMDLVLRSVPDGPVAIVRGEPIPNNQFRDLYVGEVVRLHRSNPNIEVSDVERIQVAMASLRILIEREVLYQEAVKRKFTVSDADFQTAWQEEMDRMRQPLAQEGQAGPTDDEILEMAGTSREDAEAELRKALLMEKMRDTIMKEKGVSVSDAEVRAWLDQNKGELRRPDVIHLKQIFFSPGQGAAARSDAAKKQARDRAETALKAIRAGQSFEAVARSSSDGQNKDQGGDWGPRPAASLPPFLVQAAVKLQPGELSGIIESEYGYHIVKLVESVPGEELKFEDVAPKVRRLLTSQKGKEAVWDYCSEVTAGPEDIRIYLDLESQIRLRPDLQKALEESQAVSQAEE